MKRLGPRAWYDPAPICCMVGALLGCANGCAGTGVVQKNLCGLPRRVRGESVQSYELRCREILRDGRQEIPCVVEDVVVPRRTPSIKQRAARVRLRVEESTLPSGSYQALDVMFDEYSDPMELRDLQRGARVLLQEVGAQGCVVIWRTTNIMNK